MTPRGGLSTWRRALPSDRGRPRASLFARFGAIAVVGLVCAGCLGTTAPVATTPAPPPSTDVAARFPRDAARFELQPINDSTIAFAPAEARWVRAGLVGIAVDPARGDALVGRLRVVSVRDGRAEAVVTGQITRLATGHVLLLVAPHAPWWRQRSFWWGVVAGTALVGAVSLL